MMSLRGTNRGRARGIGGLAGLAGVMMLVLLPFPSQGLAQDPEWSFQCVDCPKLFDAMTSRYLVLDAAGYPHAAYGADHLYYARYDGNGWLLETVDDSRGVGRYASIALDGEGHPHIAYFDERIDDLKCARHDGTAWIVETVVSEGAVGRYASLCLDPECLTHLVYLDETNDPTNRIVHAWQEDGGWVDETVLEEWEDYRDLSIARDAGGRLHLSYLVGRDLWYAARDTSGWQFELVDAEGTINTPSLAVDSQGEPHIAYQGGSSALLYARKADTEWTIQVVTEEGYVGDHASIALDSQDRPHISVPDAWAHAIGHAYWDGTAWLIEQAYVGDKECTLSSIALNDTDNPTICFVDDATNELRVVEKSGQEWAVHSVDKQAWAGLAPSLYVDSDGYSHIAYSEYDWPDGIMKYARWTGSWWRIETIDQGRHSGICNSLVIDEQGSAYLAYCDDYRIRYAERHESEWTVGEVTVGDENSHMSLMRTSSGLPRIAYHSGPHLTYAAFDGVTWNFQTVDNQSVVGKYNSVVMDSQGNPHISYGDTQYGDLKYAYHDGTTWHVELVESQGINGYGTSLALTQDDMPRIAFHGAYKLKMAAKDQTGWTIETIDDQMWTGVSPSLALDSAGFPRIAYQDDGNEILKYAYWDGATWHLSIIDADGPNGEFCSLKLDQDGYPRVAYYDEANGDLRYAYVPNPSGINGMLPKPESPFALRLVSPCPTRGSSQIDLAMRMPSEIRIGLCDLAGRRVALVSQGFLSQGTHRFSWDGRLENGGMAPGGVYVCKATSETTSASIRIVLIR